MLEVVLLEVAGVVAPEMLNDCTPTFGKLNPWLETDVLVNAAPLENPVCVWVAAVVLGWTGLKGAVIAPGSLEGGALPGAMIALGSTRTWLESGVIGACNGVTLESIGSAANGAITSYVGFGLSAPSNRLNVSSWSRAAGLVSSL